MVELASLAILALVVELSSMLRPKLSPKWEQRVQCVALPVNTSKQRQLLELMPGPMPNTPGLVIQAWQSVQLRRELQ
jgi:hypothetical protein